MTIPEPVTAKYESAVKGAARDAYKAYGHIYPKRELVGEAWGIAGDRWETWEGKDNPQGAARVDIRLHLYSWCQGNAAAYGFERYRTQEGKTRYRRAEYGFLPLKSGATVADFIWSTIGIPGAELMAAITAEEQLGHPARRYVNLPMDWPELTVRQVIMFAAILFRDHVPLCVDFYRLETREKPARMNRAEWARSKERQRAGLRIKWGRELDAARYEALYGEKPPRELTAS